MKHYLITCTDCGDQRKIGLIPTAVGDRIDWLEEEADGTKIISARQRIDGAFGFECLCGNNDLMTKQELTSITNKVTPDPMELEQIIKNLVPQKPRFGMEAV